MDKQKYNVTIEFDKFSKKFDSVPLPTLEDIQGAKVLSIECSNGAIWCVNWDKVMNFHYQNAER